MTSNLTDHGHVECATFTPSYMAITITYFLIFPIALVTNGVAAWVSMRLRSTSTFMVYLKNLVAADLLATLTFLIKAVSDLPGAARQLDIFVCRYSDVVFYTCMYISITLMGLISLDRFFKIVRPCGKLLGQNLIFGKLMSALVWVILFGCMAIPTMILTDQPANYTSGTTITCMSLKGPAGIHYHESIIIVMNVLFWLVSGLVVACYICIAKKVIQSFRNSGSTNSKGQKKTKLRVFLVLVLFLVCFGPYHIVRIPYTLLQTKGQKGCLQVWAKFAKSFTQWLSTTNVCLDPLLYFFLCREFREKLISMMNNMGIRSPQVAVEGRKENIPA